MDTKHTPGPWTCKHGDAISNHISADNGKIMVAAVYNIHTATGCHNAMLINSAPDLMEALERIANGQWDDTIAETPGTLAMREIARAAIRKATGTATC
jgi:hypothetical protein